jgi:tetratricopeptide (TPR) repeat protein
MGSTTNLPKRRLRVFLCHSSADKESVRKLYEWLERDGFDPWLDEKKLLPAQRWADVIEDAVRGSDVVLVCLSNGSMSKEGFLQREIKFALQIADEKPEGTIYIVPTRLEPVELPRRFREYQAANLYEANGYDRLKESLALRATQISVAPPVSTSGLRFLDFESQRSHSGAVSGRIRGLDWIQTHPRVAAIILLVVLGTATFGGIRLYTREKGQRAAAAQFYKDGLTSWKALELRKAENLFSQAAAAAPDDPLILASYALSLNERGNEAKARAISQEAYNLSSSLPKDSRRMVEGIYKEIAADWKGAEDLYGQIWQSRLDFDAGLRLAHVQVFGGSPTKALETIEELQTSGTDDPRILLEKANAEKSLGEFDQESKTLERIITLHPARDLVRATAQAEKCWTEYKNRDLEDHLKLALGDCEEAEQIFNDDEDALGQARTLTREAQVISDLDNKIPDFSTAAALQKRAIDIAQKRSAQRDEAGGRHDLANILMEQANPDPDGAGIEYDKSEELFQALGDTRGLAGVENDRAVKLIDLCRYREALESAKRAGQFWHSIGSAEEAIALANQGSMNLYLGDVADAESDLRNALLMAERAKLKVDDENWLITLGEVFTAEGKLPFAEQCFKGGPCYDLQQPATVHNADVFADAVVDYASLQIERGQVTESERLAESAIKAARGEQDGVDDEVAARAVLIKALLAEGKGAALNRAKVEVGILGKLKTKDCLIGVSAALTIARVDGRSGNFNKAREDLGKVIQRAHSLGLLGYEFEATLEQAEVDLRAGQAGTARQEAQQLISQTGEHGFLLLKEKAMKLADRAKI